MANTSLESTPADIITQQVTPRLREQPDLVPDKIVLTLLMVHDDAVLTIGADRENEDIENFWLPSTVIRPVQGSRTTLLQHANILTKLWTGLAHRDFVVDHTPSSVYNLPYPLMPPASGIWDGFLYWTVHVKVDLQARVDRLMAKEPHAELRKAINEDEGMRWRFFWLSRVQASLWSDMTTGTIVPIRRVFGLNETVELSKHD